MATDVDRKKLLFKIAKSYYEDGLTQEQIGQRLGLSRIKVSRLLNQAREDKIVQISIIPPPDSDAEIERALEARYGLDEAVVVHPSDQDQTHILRELGPAAVECLVRCLQGNNVLALTWGRSVLAVVDALPAQNWPELRVVQMLGGLGQPEAEVYGSDLARRVAEALGARLRWLPAPGLVPSKLVRDALLTDPQISDTLTLAASADLAVVGIGRPTPESVVMQAGILSEGDFEELQALGAVGDIALRFFDTNGQEIQHEIHDRIIGVDLSQIRQIPRVIAVAGGASKFEAIRAACRGHLIDVLVTDVWSAARLLEEE